ncbi:hypothetical protein AB1286_22715 [Trinickia sp. NRRL B-1857]|uniref:hypothetical protein n=1 Tax=Trinickia sp. NRRL B-1857 TaxID=3162879 RepID=UPI003D2B4B80
MTISSIGMHAAGLALQSALYASSGNEAREVGPDRDGDADDGRNIASISVSASINPQGQKVGTTINVTA